MLIAPAGRHLRITRRLTVAITDEPADTPHRPSIDLMMTSAAHARPGKVLGILLTGMGDDGADGMAMLRAQGGITIGESEESCVVFGMSRAAQERGGVERLLPLAHIAGWLAGIRARPPQPRRPRARQTARRDSCRPVGRPHVPAGSAAPPANAPGSGSHHQRHRGLHRHFMVVPHGPAHRVPGGHAAIVEGPHIGGGEAVTGRRRYGALQRELDVKALQAGTVAQALDGERVTTSPFLTGLQHSWWQSWEHAVEQPRQIGDFLHGIRHEGDDVRRGRAVREEQRTIASAKHPGGIGFLAIAASTAPDAQGVEPGDELDLVPGDERWPQPRDSCHGPYWRWRCGRTSGA